ncbi:MAG: ABC transporter ATP-binding protein [Gallionellaceae bacterium]|nr:MAG: ABC transporter ATP-binding protein [Gallionellaceae bacterium]
MLLHADNISKKFQHYEVLDNLSLSVKRGDIVSLVGKSGCGKSTLIKLISGLDSDYSGSIYINGKPLKPHSSQVGVVFQEPRLLPWLTVAENIGFRLGKAGAKHPRVNELLAEMGLQGKNDYYPKQLSGGMAQRVAIARGLFCRPKMLLLDEPFSTVDAFTKMRLQDLLRDAAEYNQATLLFVTHDIEEAVYLSDCVNVMQTNPGRIKATVNIDLPRVRNRNDPCLAALKSQVLELLDDRGGECAAKEENGNEANDMALHLAKLAL